jgi:hypothetical protein
MRLGVDLSILNQKGTPAFYSDIFANRPAFGYAGRVFISTDTGAIYEDTGTSWTLIADAGAGTTGTLQQVTTNGNTTTQGIVVTAGNVAIGTATAGAPLDVHGTGTNAQFNGTGTNNAYVFFQNAGTSKWRLGNFYNAGSNSFDIHDVANATTRFSLRNTGELYVNGYNTISNTPTFLSAGNYASNPSLNLSIPASSTFNSGASYAGMAASLLNTWQGNNTIANGAVMAGFIGVNRQSFSAAGYTETLTQGSSGIRAICGMQVLQQTGGSFAGTITHGASLLVQGVYPTTATNITYTNYYGLVINQLDEYGGVTFTNRWGIYQGGASDKNYFNGNILVKTTTDNGNALQVTGAGTFSSTVTASSLIKSGGTSSQILAADGSTITAGTNITISGGTISASGGGGVSIGSTVTGATSGSVLFVGAVSALSENNSNFYWDYLNNRLGLGLNSGLGALLHVNGNAILGYGSFFSAPSNGLLVNGNVNIGSTNISNFGSGNLLQLGNNNALVTGVNTYTMYNNLYLNAMSQYKNVSVGYTALLEFSNGSDGWAFKRGGFQGSVGNTVTLTQTMACTAAYGNILIGTSTTDNYQGKLQVQDNTFTQGLSLNNFTASISQTLTYTQSVILCTQPITLTLPTLTGHNNLYIIKNFSAGTCSVSRGGTDSIYTTGSTTPSTIFNISIGQTVMIIAIPGTGWIQIS